MAGTKTRKAEHGEISIHEARFFRALQDNAGRWMTSRDLASEAQIAYRTGRAHALKLVRLGIVDLAEVFPAHRYRLSDVAEKRNLGYFLRLCNVVKVFGIEVSTTEPEEQLRDGDAENA